MKQGHGSLIETVLYWTMIASGTVIIILSGWQWKFDAYIGVILSVLFSALYIAYGYLGLYGMTKMVCMYCGNAECDSRIKAVEKYGSGEPALFTEKFKRYIPLIVPLWVIPAIVGVVALYSSFNYTLLAALGFFIVFSYIVLPRLSTKYTCSTCPQRNNCPWYGKR